MRGGGGGLSFGAATGEQGVLFSLGGRGWEFRSGVGLGWVYMFSLKVLNFMNLFECRRCRLDSTRRRAQVLGFSFR